MEETWTQRLRRLVCRLFGHAITTIDYDSPGGGDPEICLVCGALVSTAYSRERDQR